MKYKLDDEEREILQEFEQGEMRSVPDARREMEAASAAGSILVSLVVGHRLVVRLQLIVVYAAAALQALVWYWLLVIPGGTC